jgi:hypothetical protein
MHADLHLQPGVVQYDDPNYAGRAGWKEIVIISGEGATISQASHTAADLSRALTAYPDDPTVAPPQNLRASVSWVTTIPKTAHESTVPAKSVPRESAAAVTLPLSEPASPTAILPKESKSFPVNSLHRRAASFEGTSCRNCCRIET